MLDKPVTQNGYCDLHTRECERVLVTVIRGLGPWRDSIFLVGGLVPRYLVKARPPLVPPHAGTMDVDVVIDLQILADTQAYLTLEENLKRNGFERSINDKGRKLSWRWEVRTESGALMVLELLTDAPDIAGGKVQALPTDGTISALNIPHSAMVFDHFQEVVIEAELLNGEGVVTETVRHADVVSFTCLKAFAFDHRNARKDAHDLVYCIEYADEGAQHVAQQLAKARIGKHGAVVDKALDILHSRFLQTTQTEGYRMNGPVAVAKFEIGEGMDLREERATRQREVNDLMEGLWVEIHRV